MTDLRENIYELLTKWRMDIHNDTAADGSRNYWANKPASTYDIADRILALLPKGPELRWDMCDDVEALKLGDVALGAVYRTEKLGEFIGYMNGRMTIRAGEEMARAAVEAAVRKALGWE